MTNTRQEWLSRPISSSEDTESRLARRRAVDEAYQTLEKHRINHRRIVLLDDDHKRVGGYGIVRRAHLHPSTYLPTWWASRQYGPLQVVAVKQIKISAVDDKSEVKRAFTKEMLVWSGLETHPGIARFIGFYSNAELSEAWLISPWEPNGNVGEFVRRHELEVPEKLSLIYDTIDALAFLHQLNPPVCHGDVKSANVLVNGNLRAVLCDFGLARLHEDSGFGRLETPTGFKAPIRWCSPELIKGQPRTPKSDIYAWAWLMWEIMTGELPYEVTSADYAIILKIFEDPRPQVDEEIRLSGCLQVWELMIRCWAAEPELRPTSITCQTTVASLPRCPPTVGDHGRSAALLENLGDLESWKGNYKEGFTHLENALLLYEEEGNEKGIANVLLKQAEVLHRHSDPAKALQTASTALEKLRSLNDALGTAETLYLMGSALSLQSKYDDAMVFLNEALEIFRGHDNNVGVVGCLEKVGEIQRWEGRYDDALSTLEDAVAIASRSGDKFGEARVLMVLGSLDIDRDRLDDAATIVRGACDIARRIGWEQGVCIALLRLGTIQRLQGSAGEAEELLKESISISRRCNVRWRLAQGLYGLGICLQTQGRLDESAAALEESCSLYRELSFGDWELPCTATRLAEVKKDQGATEDSLHWYDVAIAEHRKLQDKFSLSGCLADKACVLEELKRHDEAALHFEASLVLDMELEDDGEVGWNRRKLAAIPRTPIVWEGRRKLTKPKRSSLPQTSHLLCDMKKLQRRIPHLRTGSLQLEIRLNDIING